MEAEQSAQPTGTNRSNPPDPNAVPGISRGQPENRRRAAARPIRGSPAAAHQTLPRHIRKSPGQPPDPGSRAQQIRELSRGPGARRGRHRARDLGPGSSPGLHSAKTVRCARGASWRFGQPGGHSEGPNTRSHPELGRENPQRRWYCRLSGGRAGRRQARQTPQLTPGPRHTPARFTDPTPRQRSNHAPGLDPGPHTPHNNTPHRNTPPPRGGAAR